MTMSTFGERLKEARKDAKLSQGSLAKLVGVKQPTISELEADGKGSSFTPMLAKVLNVSAIWLAEGKGLKKELNPILEGHEHHLLSNSEVSVTIPALEISFEVKNNPPDILDSVFDGLKITRTWVAKKLPSIKNIESLRFAHAFGNEMSSTFEDGDILLIDTSVKSIDKNGIYAIKTNNNLIYRRVIQKINGMYEISCDNTVIKNTEVIDNINNIQIIGEVVWIWNGKKV